MTNPALDSFENHQLIDELRARGLVVCAFAPEDVISNQIPDQLDDSTGRFLDRAADWLLAHAEQIEDAMTEAGNHAIGFATDPINDDREYCRECGDLMFIEANGVSHHGSPDDIDYDADAHHVAIRDE